MDIDEVEFSVRVSAILQRHGVDTVDALCSCTAGELLSFKHFGIKSLREVKERLAELGKNLEPWNPAGGYVEAEVVRNQELFMDVPILIVKDTTFNGGPRLVAVNLQTYKGLYKMGHYAEHLRLLVHDYFLPWLREGLQNALVAEIEKRIK